MSHLGHELIDGIVTTKYSFYGIQLITKTADHSCMSSFANP